MSREGTESSPTLGQLVEAGGRFVDLAGTIRGGFGPHASIVNHDGGDGTEQTVDGGGNFLGKLMNGVGAEFFGALGSFPFKFHLANEARDYGLNKFLRGEGFNEKIIGTAGHSTAKTVAIRGAGHQDEGNDGEMRNFTNGRKGLVSVHVGHVDVAEDEIGFIGEGQFDGLGRVGSLFGQETGARQRGNNHRPDVSLVVNYQNLLHKRLHTKNHAKTGKEWRAG
jgi:hypothetical protein